MSAYDDVVAYLDAEVHPRCDYDIYSCMRDIVDEMEAENDRLREQIERLVTLLRVDCDIDASWDGLRRFWSIGLTENGCLMRDRACKADAENAKLRALCRDMYLVVELLDMDGMALQTHGKSSDWRTLKERYDELTGVDG